MLPTATTTVKGGVKIDGSTIAIANQVISVGTVPYSSISGTPTIPTNNNQLTNGAAYITSSALTGLATETYVTTRGYITTSALTDYALTSAVPTNNNQLSNGAAYITSAALSGLASETYVTTRGYLTTVAYADVTNKPTLFSGSYVDLTNKPTIPTDINQLADASGLLGQGGGGGNRQKDGESYFSTGRYTHRRHWCRDLCVDLRVLLCFTRCPSDAGREFGYPGAFCSQPRKAILACRPI